MRVMAIGAHAADMEFSVGALLIQQVNKGDQVTVVHWTLGERGHPTLSPQEYSLQKQDEAEHASHIMGCRMLSLGEPDAAL
ncbi:MAG: PIG-L deacetylase family protein, partial [Sulfobacillus sp.]